jgi:DNA-binding transcriptional LysR family regulator
LNAVFAKVKAKPRIVEEHDGFSSLIPAIESGRGVALVSESFVYSAGKRVKLLRLTPEPKPATLGIAALAGPLSKAAEKFWQCAKDAASRSRIISCRRKRFLGKEQRPPKRCPLPQK